MKHIQQLFLLIIFLCFTHHCAQAQTRKLIFDCDKNAFKTERAVLHEKFKDVYEDWQKIVESGTIKLSVNDGDFCIAKTDLNQDGVDDIALQYQFDNLYCGTAGCSTDFYTIDKKNEWTQVLSLNAYEDGVALAEALGGYRVLVIKQKVLCPCNDIVLPDGTKYLNNTIDRVFVYDGATKNYRSIGVIYE